jgi:hypothetical protein
MRRVRKRLLARALFDDATGVHHANAISESGDHRPSCVIQISAVPVSRVGFWIS